MLTDLQDSSTLSKPRASVEFTIDQALQTLESALKNCRDAGYMARVINDTQDGIPIVVLLIPRVISVKDGRGIHHFVVAQDTTGEAAHE